MARILVSANVVPSPGSPFSFIVEDVTDYDLVSDPMTITKTVVGHESDGTPVEVEFVREYDKASYSAEVIEDGA